MKIEVEIPAAVIHDVIHNLCENFPEACLSYSCTKWKYKDLRFTFVDEDGKEHNVTEVELTKAFELMMTKFYNTIPGPSRPPLSAEWEPWDEWLCQSDASTFDAFIQLAIEGDIIYG